MENILVTVTIGGALVLLIDFIRKIFPKLTVTQIKFITVGLSVLLSGLTFMAQSNPVVAEGVKGFLIILGTSQALYGLVFRDTELHKDLTKDGVAQG